MQLLIHLPQYLSWWNSHSNNILTNSVLHFLVSFAPPCFHCSDCHQPCFGLIHWPLCWPNQSANMWSRTHIRVLWAFRSIKAILNFDIRFVEWVAVVIADIWIIEVTIADNSISSVGNAFRWNIVITFGWMTADSPDSADISCFSPSSREVPCRQSGCQRWSFSQYICCHTIRWKVWPRCSDDLFSIWNVSHSCYLLGLGERYLLCSTEVLAALPHLQKVIDRGHSVQFPFLHLFHQFQVVFSVIGIECRVISCQYSVICSSKLPDIDFSPEGLCCGFRLSPTNDISPQGKTGLHSDKMWYDREYVACHIGEIGMIWVCFLLLTPRIGDIRYPKCTTNLHWVAVVIIKIGSNLPPVGWCVRRWIHVEPGGGQ